MPPLRDLTLAHIKVTNRARNIEYAIRDVIHTQQLVKDGKNLLFKHRRSSSIRLYRATTRKAGSLQSARRRKQLLLAF